MHVLSLGYIFFEITIICMVSVLAVYTCDLTMHNFLLIIQTRKKKLIFVELARNHAYSNRANTETIQTTVHFYELQKHTGTPL